MTLSEYRVWFDGFCSVAGNKPTFDQKQLAIRKLGEVVVTCGGTHTADFAFEPEDREEPKPNGHWVDPSDPDYVRY